MLLWAPPADAHAFLAQSSPASGARLATAPAQVALAFTERVARATIRVTRSRGGAATPLRVERAGPVTVVRADLPPMGAGVYVVDWQVTSADDGHETAGEFAFAVGGGAGRLPSSSTSSSTDFLGAVIALAVFAGLATAGGVVLTALAVDRSAVAAGLATQAGLGLGAAAALVAYLRTITAVSPTARSALAAGLSALAFGLGLAVSGLRPLHRRLTMAAVVAAAAAWSARGHAAILHGLGGEAADTVHLLAAALWAGCLGVLAVRAARSGDDRARLLAFAKPYARLALVLVTVLGVAGAISAVQLLPSVSDVWRTGYGQLLIAKSALFAVALLLAGLSRWRGIGAGRIGPLRRLVPWETGAVAVILVLAGFLVTTAPPVGATAVDGNLLGPPPLPGPVSRSAGLAGELTIGVASGNGQLQVQVWDPNHTNPPTRVTVDATLPDGRQVSLTPRGCGPGCFSEAFSFTDGATHLVISVVAAAWRGGLFDAVIRSPPGPSGLVLLRDVAARMHSQPHVVVTEQVSSGPGETAPSSTFTLSGAALAADEPWGGGIADEAVTAPGGKAIDFYLAGEPLWGTLVLDGDGRIATERLVDVGHVVTHQFSYPRG